MRGDLSLPTTGSTRLIDIIGLVPGVKKKDMQTLATLLRSQRGQSKSMQGSRFPLKAKQYTSPYPELRGRM